MIAFIRGKIDFVNENSVIIDNNGIGYEVFVSPATIAKISGRQEVKLYTYLQIKEDNTALFGFAEKEELKMFHLLISVSGIGPKSALNMLASSTPQNIMLAIISEDIKAMSQFPGIGKKTAGRLILELKDKIKSQDAVSSEAKAVMDSVSVGGESNEKTDAIDALCALGYGRSEAVRAVLSVYDESMAAQDIIKGALKKLAKA